VNGSGRAEGPSLEPDLVFWPGGLGPLGFAAVLEATAAGGFTRMAISPLMIHQLLATGSAAGIIAQAHQSGVTLSDLDGVSSWAPLWHEDNSMPWIRERFDFTAAQCLDMASATGLTSVLVVGAFDRGALDIDTLTEHFGAFCDDAAARDIRVELEAVSYWGIPELPMAWEIVRGAGRPNSGLVIDTWHLQKGSTDFQRDLEVLESIPADRLTNLQVADALLAPRADSLYAERRFSRFPGDGELAIEQVVRLLDSKGGLKRIGTEMVGHALDGLTPAEVGRRSALAVRTLLYRARPA
jgi:sugar phosphate isomerase/epimerase